jgi:hypothetical protein
MYVIKKCDNYTYGRNKWYTVHTTASKEDAIAFCRAEYRLLLSCDPNMSSQQIEQALSGYRCPRSDYWYGRMEFGHGNIRFAAYKSSAEGHMNVPKRPTRTELLDKILN